MKKRCMLLKWLYIKFILIGFVIFLFSFNYIFSKFWFDSDATLKKIQQKFSYRGVNGLFDRDQGKTPLQIAASLGNLDVVKFLVSKGADVNSRVKKFQKFDYKNMPLHLACQEKKSNVAEFLIDNNANMTAYNADEQGSTPVHLSSAIEEVQSFQKVINKFVEHGANINIPDKRRGATLIFWLADMNKIEFIKFLVKKYPHLINLRLEGTKGDARGKNAVEYAQYKFQRDAKALDYLRSVKPVRVDGTANFNSRDKRGFTVPMYAALKGRTDIFNIIKNRPGTNLNLKDTTKMGNTALHWACIYNEPKSVQTLIKLGASPIIENNLGAKPIYYVDGILDSKERKKVIDLLLKNGVNINSPNDDKNTLLHRTAIFAMHDVAKELVKDFQNLINFRAKNNKKETALDIAKKRRDKVLINLFKPFDRRVGAGRVNFMDKGSTPLMIAAMRGDLEDAKYLLRLAAKVNLKAKVSGDTALHFAIENGNIKMAQLLLADPKTDVNAKNNEGNTPLHEVVKIADPKEREILAGDLIKRGANISDKNNKGDTILHLAVEKNMLGLVKFLKDRIGSLVKNKAGKTPADLARDLKQKDITKILAPN